MGILSENSPIFISIVVPCYNEELRIHYLLSALNEFNQKSSLSFEFILIDDCSTDKTLNIVNSNTLIKDLKNRHLCTIYSQKVNAGKGEALKTGVALSKGKYILTMDADIATHPLEVTKWMGIENLTDNTTYIGSREHVNSKIKSGFTRKFTGRVFNLIVRLLTPLDLKDTQCGFKLYPSAIGKKIFSELINTGWAHDIELLYRLKLYGYKIKEMPITWNSVEGSKISVIKDSMRMFTETIRIRRLLKKQNGLKRN